MIDIVMILGNVKENMMCVQKEGLQRVLKVCACSASTRVKSSREGVLECFDKLEYLCRHHRRVMVT